MIPKRIPRKAKWAGTVYKIKKVSESQMPRTDDDEETIHHAYCDTEKTTIYILKDLSLEAQRSSFEHEGGHASSEESGARAIMAKFTTNYMDLEEHLCRIWLPCFLDGLRTKVK